MQVRLECSLDDLVGNWIELSEIWTRAELKAWRLSIDGAFGAESDSVLFGLLEKQTVAVHMFMPDGTLIVTPSDLVAKFDDLDSRLVRWLAAGITQAQRDLMNLAEARKRLLYDGAEIAALMSPQTPRR
jgi:hypothetical protein